MHFALCSVSPSGRTPNFSAVQQVFSSLLKMPRLLCLQKSIRFIFSIGVDFASEYFTNTVGVCSKKFDNVVVSLALNAHHMGGNCLTESERFSPNCDNVQFDTGKSVSFVMGESPKQIIHVQNPCSMVGRIATGAATPAIQWCRNLRKGAVSLAGEGVLIPFSGLTKFSDSRVRLQEQRPQIVYCGLCLGMHSHPSALKEKEKKSCFYAPRRVGESTVLEILAANDDFFRRDRANLPEGVMPWPSGTHRKLEGRGTPANLPLFTTSLKTLGRAVMRAVRPLFASGGVA